MKKSKVIVICPGRGSYTRESIGFINKYGSNVINKITQFETLLLSELRSKEKKLLESISKEQALSEVLEKKINDFLESLVKKFIEDNQ